WPTGGIANTLVMLVQTTLTPILGTSFTLVFHRLRPWRVQGLIYLFLWAQSLFFLLLLYSHQAFADSLLWLWCLPILIATSLCWANLALLPTWFSFLGPRAEQSSSGDPFPYFLVAIGFFGGLIGVLVNPFFLEPLIELYHQVLLWKAAYGVIVFLVMG